MTGELTREQRRERIDEHLAAALDSARGEYLQPARTAVARDERWYGQLLALVHDAAAESPDGPSILRAAAAMELFAGYRRLRERSLARCDTGAWRSNAVVLASDYLHAAAYATLGSLAEGDVAACIGTLASASRTITEALADADRESPSPAELRSYVDDTAGELGRGAAVVGATLAGADHDATRRFATAGRGFSVDRRIRRPVADGTVRRVESSGGPQLDRHARRRRTEARRALEALPSTVDVAPLCAFVEEK